MKSERESYKMNGRIQPCDLKHIERYGKIYAAAFSGDSWKDSWKTEDAAIHVQELLEAKTSIGFEYVRDDKAVGLFLALPCFFIMAELLK